MTKLEQLIQDLCPNGVKMVKLKDISEMKRGKSITKKDVVLGDIPVISGGKGPAYYCNQANRDGDIITVAGSGVGAGYVQYWEKPIFVCDSFSVKGKENVNTKYLYYFLTNQQERINALKKGGGVPHVHISDIENFEIPLPPLAVQSEIVRLLDKFTLYKSELAAELAARLRQYEYYRDKLLTFDNTVKRVKLGEVGEFYGGLTGKTKEDFKEGNAKFITYKNIFSNLALDIDIEDRVFITEGEKQNIVQYGDVLFTGSSETPDECGMSSVLTTPTDEKLYLNSFCFGWRLFDKSIYLPDFLKHLFRCAELRKQIGKTASGVTRFNVSKAKMKKVSIPLPPLSEQERIVSILDRFDKLCHDIREGLPAEIELRQKQYEHYRDKLLTFTDIIGYKNL